MNYELAYNNVMKYLDHTLGMLVNPPLVLKELNQTSIEEVITILKAKRLYKKKRLRAIYLLENLYTKESFNETNANTISGGV